MTTLQIHVGGTFADTEQRVLDAVARHERGEDVVMTANRLELLRHVHRTPPRSVLALARALGRDYKRVHEDVEALVAAGLLDRSDAGLRADYDAIRIGM